MAMLSQINLYILSKIGNNLDVIFHNIGPRNKNLKGVQTPKIFQLFTK